MKTRNILWGIASIAATLSMGSCSSDNPADNLQQSNGGSRSFKLTSTILDTRTTNTTLQNGTQIEKNVLIGVFLKDATTSGSSDGEQTETAETSSDYDQSHANCLLIADGNGNLTQADYNSSLEFPFYETTGNDTKINIYAYAPYNSAWSNLEGNTFSVATDQSTDEAYIASDLLYGVPTSNPVSESTTTTGTQTIPLTFKHLMAKILLNFSVANGNSSINLAGATATLQGVSCSATVNLTDGSVTPVEHTVQRITVATETTDTSGESISPVTTFNCAAVIIPQTVGNGTAFIRLTTADGQHFLYYIDDTEGKTFAGGNSYTYTLQVGETTSDNV